MALPEMIDPLVQETLDFAAAANLTFPDEVSAAIRPFLDALP